tara:strand:- start:663 stop:1490 length:828 start_codon:yes stop_codon:yes gene_type:complete
MARNQTQLSQVIDDFIISLESDNYASGASDNIIRSYALRGIREMGFDILKKIRSLKITVDTTNNTAEFPDDFVDWTKIGVVGNDGIVYALGENKNINQSQAYATANGSTFDSDNDGLLERVDSKGATDSGSPSVGSDITDGMDSIIFRNYIYDNVEGRIYGAGGGQYYAQFRVNMDQNRIELKGNNSIKEIVIEYIADEARSTNPSVHVYAEEALRAYIYYKIIERKSSVPANEKMRARSEYYNERRLANARIKSFTKEEALKTIRKNFKQAPKR